MLSGGRQPPPLSAAQRERERNSYRERPFAVYANQARVGKERKEPTYLKKNKKKRNPISDPSFFLLEILRRKIYGIFQVAVSFRSRRTPTRPVICTICGYIRREREREANNRSLRSTFRREITRETRLYKERRERELAYIAVYVCNTRL
jgi:hypothetical protein